MQKLTLLTATTALLALAGCGSAEDEAVVEPAAEETVAAPAPAAQVQMAADGQPAPGTYEVTLPDGNVITEIVNADGSYNWTATDGTTGNGTWRTEGPNVWCTTEEGEEEECADEVVGADGVWTSVNRADPEDTATIVRVQS